MITTASDLWAHWVEAKQLRPKDYDRDIVEMIRSRLGNPAASLASLPEAMDREGWTARDLLQALLPLLASFSGMLSGLLGLYERVNASRTQRKSLRISYEFEDGNRIDDRLGPFREKVQRTQSVVAEIDAFYFLDNPWNSPLSIRAEELHFDSLHAATNFLGILPEEVDGWRFSSAFPSPATESIDIQNLIAAHGRVIGATLEKLSMFGPTTASLRDVPFGRDIDSSLVRSALDLWWLSQVGILNLTPNLVQGLDTEASAQLVREQAYWLESFWARQTISIDQQVEDLSYVLELPYWGRRHDLYSAWVASALDAALSPNRLRFEISDGKLAFPFHETLLARLETARGPVELWTEKKFSASGLIGKGRKNHVQPDYVFLQSTQPNAVIGVVEAKQYLRANNKNHGEAAHDYAHALPNAEVFVVAHGPAGTKGMERVALIDQPRVSFHGDIRPHSDAAVSAWAEKLVALLPPLLEPKVGQAELSRPADFATPAISTEKIDRTSEYRLPDHDRFPSGTVVLRWSAAVKDLDLYLIDGRLGEVVYYENRRSAHAELGSDGFDGGPETAIFYSRGQPIEIEVHLYSTDVDGVSAAEPRITISSLDGVVSLRPRDGEFGNPRVWHVGTIEPDGTIVSPDSV
jgi:hypothetical protein